MSIKTYGRVTVSKEGIEVKDFVFVNADNSEALLEAMQFALPELQFRIRQMENTLWWRHASGWAKMMACVFRTHRPMLRSVEWEEGTR